MEKKTKRMTIPEQMNLPSLIDTLLTMEKMRVAAQVRQAHLKKRGRSDPETDEVIKKMMTLEEYISGLVAQRVMAHPSYPWFSQIRGVGKENIGKVIGFIKVELDPNNPPKDPDHPNWADTISALWKFAGFAPGEDGKTMKRTKGKTLEYNIQLKSMCWRLTTALKLGGLKTRCVKCGHSAGMNPEVCPNKDKTGCDSTEFRPDYSKFAELYLKEKVRLEHRFTRDGYEIKPTPAAGWECKNCKAKFDKKEDSKKGCCSDQFLIKVDKAEPEGVIWRGHLEMMATRKMIKVFLACLWLTWREGLGLPVRAPYPIDKLGHTGLISPWELVDEPELEKKKGGRKKVAAASK